MRLTVFGATGGTGRQIVMQAKECGHDVTVLARRPEALPATTHGVEVVAGDVLDPSAVARAVQGADAVLSALGIGYRRHATTVYSLGTANIVQAMIANGVRRLVVVSTSSLEIPPRRQTAEWLLSRFVLHPLLRRPYSDMRLMEQYVRGIRPSDVDWTLVRAARLTNGSRTGRYRTAVDGKLPGCWSISRPDLARYMLTHLGDGNVVGRTVEIAY